MFYFIWQLSHHEEVPFLFIWQLPNFEKVVIWQSPHLVEFSFANFLNLEKFSFDNFLTLQKFSFDNFFTLQKFSFHNPLTWQKYSSDKQLPYLGEVHFHFQKVSLTTLLLNATVFILSLIIKATSHSLEVDLVAIYPAKKPGSSSSFLTSSDYCLTLEKFILISRRQPCWHFISVPLCSFWPSS